MAAVLYGDLIIGKVLRFWIFQLLVYKFNRLDSTCDITDSELLLRLLCH